MCVSFATDMGIPCQILTKRSDWTRMPDSHTLARSLSFYTGGVDPLDDYYRSYGVSARQCRESR